MRLKCWCKFLLVLGLSALADIASSAEPRGVLPRGQAQEREIGSSYLIGGWWFQYLGRSAERAELWLFPHLDAVPEIFTAPKDAATWQGSLDSVFHPGEGRFANLFNAAEVLNELYEPRTQAPARRQAARLLGLYRRLHPDPKGPYYLRPYEKDLERALGAGDREWLAARQAWQAEMLKRAPRAGTQAPALRVPCPLEQGPKEYYRRLVADGYLDLAVIGGNLYDPGNATFNSWEHVEKLRGALRRLGLNAEGFRDSNERTLLTGTARMLGQSVRVRVNLTGGSTREHRIVRTVANFVEGLARADLVFYHGHSNYESGKYWLSESPNEFACFQIGMSEPRDLTEKCYGLGRKPYQIFGFQSCTSYPRYARTVRWHYERELPGWNGALGVLGNPTLCSMRDFAPRYAALVELLLQERPPREILQKLNALVQDQNTPHLVMRGLLQPRLSFIVPRGVKMKDFQEEDADAPSQVFGEGADGRTYASTEVFVQDTPGEIVQAVPLPGRLYGLGGDGILYEYGEGTGGAMRASAASRDPKLKFVFAARTDDRGRPRVLLTGADGRLYRYEPGASGPSADLMPPRGVRFVAAGLDEEQRIVAQGDDEAYYAWDAKARRYEKLERAPGWDRQSVTPSLSGRGIAGELWTPEGVLRP
ncbi:MAG: hypothetical protein M5U26_23995 [Planctomycetota bacterium]|nr:hypothetical protein [Planctomycetota bacterium]